MANLVWFLVILAVASVSTDDIKGVLPLPEGADVKIEPLAPASIPALKLTKSKPIESMPNSKDLEPETFLQPIGPIFPSFFQPKPMFGMPQSDDSQPKHGILTIILMKSKPSSDSQQDSEENLRILPGDASQFNQNMIQSAEERFKSLTQFLLSDLFGVNSQQQQQQEAANGMPLSLRDHLFGGRDDPDHFLGFKDGGDDSDFIRFNGGELMPIMSEDIGRHSENHHGKKCNFMNYLKLKAHIHYRTIVHLVFISGIILMILLMISLTIKVHKRRNALRRYVQQNMNVSSIDSALAKHNEAECEKRRHGHIFRSGTLTQSYEQKMAPSVFIAAPPAYDQINKDEEEKKKTSSLIKSLSQAYKNRYQRMTAESDDDRKSISSLPPYEDKPEPNN